MFSKTAMAILFNLLQVRPSVPFFAVLFMSSLNVLSRYFMFNQIWWQLPVEIDNFVAQIL